MGINKIKKMKEADLEKEEILWNYKLDSSIISDLSVKDINDCILSYKDPKYKNWRKEFDKKMHSEYDKFPVAKWQNDKTEEFEKSYFSNLKISINKKEILVSTNFNILVTPEFDSNDIINWAEGLSRIKNIFIFVYMERIIEKKHSPEIYKKQISFLDVLIKNEKYLATKI